MSTSKWVAGAAIVVGLLDIGIALYEHTVRLAATEAIVAENRTYQSSLAQLQELKRQSERVKQELAALKDAAGKPGAPRANGTAAGGAAGSGNGAARAAGRPAARSVNWELSGNPEVRESLSGWIKGTLNVAYGPMFKSMGLSAAQIDSFENLILQENINMGAAILTLRPQDETEAQVQQAMQAMLGPDNFQQFTQYQNSVFVREAASGLAANLYDTATPLTPPQAEQLTQIMARNSTLPPNSGPPFPGTINWEAVYAQAQGLLSAPQLAALQNEGTLISSQGGLWGGINPISPGALGNTAMPPGGFYASPPPRK